MLVFSMKRCLCQFWGGLLSGHSWEGWLSSFSPQPHQILPQVQQLSRSINNEWVILSFDLMDNIVSRSLIDLWWKPYATTWTFKTAWSNLSVVFKAFARKSNVFLYKNISGHSELVQFNNTLLQQNSINANCCFARWSMSLKFWSLKHASSITSFIESYNLSAVMPSMELYINDVTAATDLEDFFMADFRSASFLYLSAPVNFGHSSSNCIRNHLDLILQTKEDPQ